MIRHVRHNRLIRAVIVMAAVWLALSGLAWAQDKVPEPSDSVEPAQEVEPGQQTDPPDEDQQPAASDDTPPAEQESGDTNQAPAEEATPESPAEVLKQQYGVDVANLEEAALAKKLADVAQAIVDLDSRRTSVQTAATTAATVRKTLLEQVGPTLPEQARRSLVPALAQRTVSVARYRGELSTVEERLQRQRAVQKLLAQHASALRDAAAAQAEKVDQIDETEKVRLDANKAEKEAIEAVRVARQREARERDATIKELLARETKLAEEVLALTRKHGEELLNLQEETEDEMSVFADAKAEVLGEIDEIPEQPSDKVRRARVDPAFARLVRLRREARDRLSATRDLMGSADREVRDAAKELEKAQEAVAEEQDRRAQLEGTVGERRVAVAKAQLAVAEERHDAAVARQEAFRRRMEQYKARIEFFSDTIHELLPLVSEQQHDEFFRINDGNWRDAVAGVQEGLLRIVNGGLERLEQAKDLDFSSINLWGWVGGFSWRLVVALLLLRVVPPMVPEQVKRLISGLLRRRFFRLRTRLTIKLGEVINGLAHPLLALAALRYLLGGYLVRTFPEVEILLWFVDAVFIYWIVIELASVVILPRWYRHEKGKRSANDLLEVDETDAAMADLVGMEVERARKLLRSIKVVALFWLLATYVPDLVAEVTGINILWWFVDRVAVFGLIGIVYWVISTWKDDIAALFERLASARIPGAVTFVNRQKDRPWGVLIIAVASVYVVVVELYLVVRKYVIDTEVFRRASTFAFRKKIEMQAREREETEPGDGELGELPTEYVEFFDSEPLEAGSPLYVERGEWEDDVAEMYETWRATSRQGSVALIGEAGIGKTTLLMHIYAMLEARHEVEVTVRSVTQKHHRRGDVLEFMAELFELDEVPEHKAELIEQIRALEPRIIALDDCHHFFVRRIGGFDGLDALLDIVNLTDEQHFWILTFNVFAWSYVNRVNPREHYFGRIVALRSWSEDEIQTLVERRNGHTGWATSFTDLVVAHDDADGSDYFYEVVKTARGYFRYLHEFSDGNPRVAMVFWLRSVRTAADNVMSVSLFRRPGSEDLAEIGDNHWFVLTALAQHGELNPEEIAKIINVGAGFCHLALNFFEEKGIVEVDPETGRAALAPLYFRHVLRSLMNSNYLYR